MDNRSDRHYMREWREAKGLTQEQVATALDTHRGMVSRYENNKRDLTVSLIIKIARIFDITLAEFFTDPGEASLMDLLQATPPKRRREALAALHKLLKRD